MASKVHVKKGDQVAVVSGKNKGKRGKVLRVILDTQRVIVEGVNMVKKHQRPTQKVMQGGIIDKEAPLSASAVMIWCPRCQEPSRTRSKILDDGKKVRTCARCGEVLDK
ncbi:MAG: 50S ribosomal protein L24 [Bacillota bacterium]|nr:50S ribosomal protein L24 [Bacillota bacterium]